MKSIGRPIVGLYVNVNKGIEKEDDRIVLSSRMGFITFNQREELKRTNTRIRIPTSFLRKSIFSKRPHKGTDEYW